MPTQSRIITVPLPSQQRRFAYQRQCNKQQQQRRGGQVVHLLMTYR
jgi:hypothetical protein